jgi:WD40 repeat protein
VRSIAFSPDDQTLATGSADDMIILWDVQTAKPRLKLKSKESHARTLSFSADGATLTCGCALVARTAHDRDARVTALSSTIDLIVRERGFSWQEIGGEVKMWDVQTGKILLTMRTSGAVVRAIICPPDCKLAGNKIDDHSVLLWNANSGKLEMNLSGHKRLITAIAFSPNGRLVASASADKTVKLWDVSDSKAPR